MSVQKQMIPNDIQIQRNVLAGGETTNKGILKQKTKQKNTTIHLSTYMNAIQYDTFLVILYSMT